MHSDLVDIGWTETQWNRVLQTVTEEAQRARIAAQVLPLSGPEEASTIAVPNFGLAPATDPYPYPPVPPGAKGPLPQRLTVDSDPTLYFTTIGVNVPLRTYEAADPNLSAALTMFRRAASYVARIEDALVFNGRAPNAAPTIGLGKMPPVFSVTGNSAPEGIFGPAAPAYIAKPSAPATGDQVFEAVVNATGHLEGEGQFGPFACILSPQLFKLVCTPNTASSILPRDRILPFLQGPLLRSSAVPDNQGAVIALSGAPVEIVVASDINVRFLQTSLEPRLVFRVCERIALRIKEPAAIAIIV